MEKPTASEAMRRLLSSCVPGDILQGTVETIDKNGVGVRVDGAYAVIPRGRIALSPVCGPERFQVGQTVWGAVWRIDRQTHTITLTHRELLGTFDELIRSFSCGRRYPAIVCGEGLVELAPNLIAEVATGALRVCAGDAVWVRITEIDRMGRAVRGELCAGAEPPSRTPFTYYITNSRIKHWSYATDTQNFCEDETVFVC